jgi:hypothetical protein
MAGYIRWAFSAGTLNSKRRHLTSIDFGSTLTSGWSPSLDSTFSIGTDFVELNLLTFQNFQGFKGNQHAKVAPLTLIFGPNASGKSSTGRALRVFKQTVELPDQTVEVDQVWDGPSIRMRDKRKIVFRQLNAEEAPVVMGQTSLAGHDNRATERSE